MRRFIIIDQNIIGEGGHYLSYARSVLNCAAEEGFLPVLCVNRRFVASKELPYCVYPAFTYTSSESVSSFRLRSYATDWIKKEYLWGGVVKPVLQRAARIIFGSHYQKARARLFPSNRPRSEETEEHIYKASCYKQDCLTLIATLKPNKTDIVFFPTVSVVELRGLEQALRAVDLKQFSTIHVLFRQNAFRGRRETYNKELQRMAYEKVCFQNCEDIKILRFHTDSERLTDQYNYFSKCKFSTLPIPHTEYSASYDWIRKQERIVSYLGDARSEKGFLHLMEIIDAFSNEKVRFQIQANFNIWGGEGGIASYRKKLKLKANVTLYETALTAEKYSAALMRTDIILILYDYTQYYARTSGIFAEAVAIGIPALVPADTWMSYQVCKGRYAQLNEIVTQIEPKQTEIEINGTKLFWKRNKRHVSHLILRFTAVWDNSGDSVRVEAIMRSDNKTELKKLLDFIERDEDKDCFLAFDIAENCKEIEFNLNGTYGQAMPKILSVKAIELSDNNFVVGSICRIFDNYDQCGAIVKSMLENYESIKKSAELYSKKWSSYHNPKSLIRQLV